MFAVLCESKINPEKAYKLLEEMKDKFYSKFNDRQISASVDYGLDFSGSLKELIAFII